MKIKEKQIQNRCQEVFLFFFFFPMWRIITVWNSLPGKIVKAKRRRSLNKQLDCKQIAKTMRCGLSLFSVWMFWDKMKPLAIPQALNVQTMQRELANILMSLFLRFQCEIVECHLEDFHVGILPLKHMCLRRNTKCENIKFQVRD